MGLYVKYINERRESWWAALSRAPTALFYTVLLTCFVVVIQQFVSCEESKPYITRQGLLFVLLLGAMGVDSQSFFILPLPTLGRSYSENIKIFKRLVYTRLFINGVM